MSFVRIDAKTAIGVEIQCYAPAVDPSVVDEWRRLEASVTRAVERVTFLRSAPDYTARGRAERIAATKAEALKALDGQRATIERFRKRQTEIEQQVLAPRPAKGVEELLMEREVRDRLYGKLEKAGHGIDPLVIEVMHREARERGDAVFQRAIENAPASFPLISPEYAKRLRQERLEASDDWTQVNTDLQRHVGVLQAAERDITTAGNEL